MTKKKAEYPKVTFRTTRELIVKWNKWYRAHKKLYPYATKNLTLSESFYQTSEGKIKMPWETNEKGR